MCGRRHPLAGGATQFRACCGDVVRGHHDGHEVQQEGEQAGYRAQGRAGEIGDPGGLYVLEDFAAEAVDLRQFEIRVLTYEVADLLVQVGQAVDHGDHLLHEHVAEQTEQRT